jgi:hypothetical protein
VEPASVMDGGGREIRNRLAVSATVTVAGVALSTAVDQSLGGYVTVFGIVMLIFSLHRFGRTGPS